MKFSFLALEPDLKLASRLRGGDSSACPRAWELGWLMLMGTLAALASQFLDFSLRIPGHAILRSIVPMALGFALVPRRGAGTTMGLSAGAVWLILRGATPATSGLSTGSLTSLLLAGPAIDAALAFRAYCGMLFVPFALAGLATNLAAYAVRAGSKAMHVGDGRGLGSWWAPAIVSYTVCGLIAGATSALILFRQRSPKQTTETTDP